MKNNYTLMGAKNGVTCLTDRHGRIVYVEDDISTYYRPGETVELSDSQVVFEGELAAHQRLSNTYNAAMR